MLTPVGTPWVAKKTGNYSCRKICLIDRLKLQILSPMDSAVIGTRRRRRSVSLSVALSDLEKQDARGHFPAVRASVNRNCWPCSYGVVAYGFYAIRMAFCLESDGNKLSIRHLDSWFSFKMWISKNLLTLLCGDSPRKSLRLVIVNNNNTTTATFYSYCLSF